MTYREMTVHSTAEDDLRKENAALKEKLKILCGGLHPYNEEIHTKKKCPVCGWKHAQKGSELKDSNKEYIACVSMSLVPAKKRWFGTTTPEHLVLTCGTCKAEYKMEVSPEMLGLTKPEMLGVTK